MKTFANLLVLAASISLGSTSFASEVVTLFSGDVNTSLLDQPVKLPVVVSGLADRIQGDDRLFVTVNSDLTYAFGPLGRFLEQQINSYDSGCRQRAKGENGRVRVENGRLHLSVNARIEKWLCEEFLGKEVKTRVARESGTVEATILPQITDGRIQLSLEHFSISGLSSFSRELGVEESVKRSMANAIDRFNSDLSKTSLPDPLTKIGFEYDTIALDGSRLNVSIVGPNSQLQFTKALFELVPSP